MKVRISEEFRVAYKRLKKRHKSLEADFERSLLHCFKTPFRAWSWKEEYARFALPSLRKGVEGVIRRVKRCKRVVVELEGIASVAIAYVPAALLKEIEK